ncbi:hypothetical protein [Rhodococcus sp. OAS809]|uniref:hypothetical protein n=1 Tax=Rhodococcus sp. OAS809 TaxID=2663874 RepID=UPI00178B1B6F
MRKREVALGTGLAVLTPRGRAGFDAGAASAAEVAEAAGGVCSWAAGSSAVVASTTTGGTAGSCGAVGSTISVAAVMVSSGLATWPTSTPKSSANPANYMEVTR